MQHTQRPSQLFTLHIHHIILLTRCRDLPCLLLLCVGLRFLSSPLQSILTDLSTLIQSSEDELTTLQGQEKYLVKDLETTEKSIEEIVGKEQKAQ